MLSLRNFPFWTLLLLIFALTACNQSPEKSTSVKAKPSAEATQQSAPAEIVEAADTGSFEVAAVDRDESGSQSSQDQQKHEVKSVSSMPKGVSRSRAAPAKVLPGYYLDAKYGNDTNSGRKPSEAWATLARLNEAALKPGDQIFLRSGQTFHGQVRPKVSGQEGAPIILGSYGEGKKPILDARGEFESTIFLRNCSHWVLENLEIVNQGPEPKAKRKGVHLLAEQGTVVKNLILRNLTIRDVNGVVSKDEGGGFGLKWEAKSQRGKSRFDGLLVEDCHFLRCDRNAMGGGLNPWQDLSFLSTNVIIRRNLIEDIGGDGIVILGCDGAIVEYNRIYGARRRFDTSDQDMVRYAGPSIGIWPWSSKNTEVRYNEVWGYKGIFDGQGFDSDWNCENTLFEYNLSGDNAGGFFLICSMGEFQKSGTSIGNSKVMIRHNISFNDHLRGFVFNGPVSEVDIVGNIIYNTIEEDFPIILDTSWQGFALSVNVRDNLFYTRGEAKHWRGTWAGDHEVGGWKRTHPITKNKHIKFRGNAYSNVVDHREPNMKQLSEEETLSSLMGRMRQDPEVVKGFKNLISFLRESRHWDKLEGQFSPRVASRN